MREILNYKDILVCGNAGEIGAHKIFLEKFEELDSLFKKEYIYKLKKEFSDIEKEKVEFDKLIKETVLCEKDDILYNIRVEEMGVMTAIYELATKCDVGVSIEVKKIPIKQSTIEICEKYDINAYRLLSDMHMIVCKNGYELEQKFLKIGLEVARVGEFTPKKDKIVIDKEEIEYINKETKDEIYKVIGR